MITSIASRVYASALRAARTTKCGLFRVGMTTDDTIGSRFPTDIFYSWLRRNTRIRTPPLGRKVILGSGTIV